MKMVQCRGIVICFQISIFELQKTARTLKKLLSSLLWFAFKLVSLSYRRQLCWREYTRYKVVICFQISIFELQKTAIEGTAPLQAELWFAFKLVSLSYRRQLMRPQKLTRPVVICFQISIFELQKTARSAGGVSWKRLWFAFKLVSLSYRRQLQIITYHLPFCCDLLSN